MVNGYEKSMNLTREKSGSIVLLALTATSVLVFGALGQDAAAKQQEEWKAPIRASKRKNPIPADDKSVARGKELYAQNCLSCHGALGKGDGPAAKDLPKKVQDLADPKTVSESDGALFWKITEGKAPMTSYEKLLPEEDRWHLVNFLRKLAPPKKEDAK
jgi:mono/diheme cytochrome c family protein